MAKIQHAARMKHFLTCISVIVLSQFGSYAATTTAVMVNTKITVKQKAGDIQIPVLVSSDTNVSTVSIRWGTIDGTAKLNEDFYFTGTWQLAPIAYTRPFSLTGGIPRHIYLPISIRFTESTVDKTFTVVLDTEYPAPNTLIGNPSSTTITILGLPPQYPHLQSAIEKIVKKLYKTGKIKNLKKRKKTIRKLHKRLRFLQAQLNALG